MKKVTILCGISGSGKSTLAKNLANNSDFSRVLSADDYFINSVTGVYEFDPSKLGAAHGKCLRDYTDALSFYSFDKLGDYHVIVDNTNTSIVEIAPYAALALAYGFKLEIIVLKCDPAIAASRNTHGVPTSTVEKMSKNLEKMISEIPPWRSFSVCEV